MTQEEFRRAFAPGREVRAEAVRWRLGDGGLEVLAHSPTGEALGGFIPLDALHETRFLQQPGQERRWRSFPAVVSESRFDPSGRGAHLLRLQSVHRYVTRVRTLVRRLEEALAARDARLRLTFLGVDHTHHVFPDAIPALAEADLVSLELPTTPVKAYLQRTVPPGGLHIRNIFWLDLLEHFRRRPPPLGVVGCNVNPHVRYLRGRLYYGHGSAINDFEAPPVSVAVPSEGCFRLEELGGAEDGVVPAAEVLEALPEPARETYERSGIVHVGPEENPFGPGRHLVVFHPAPEEIRELEAFAADLLRPLAAACNVDDDRLARFILEELLEGFLLSLNDFYLLEALLTAAARAVPRSRGGTIRVTHVAGIAHLPHLESYLRDAGSGRISVETARDPRFTIHPVYLIPRFFADELERTLTAIGLHGERIVVDGENSRELVRRFLLEHGEEVERRLLVHALWHRDAPPPAQSFVSAADGTPLAPSREYLDRYLRRLDRTVLEYALAEQPLHVLREINRRLARGRRRGIPAAVAQELYELGWGQERLKEHPVLGFHVRAREELELVGAFTGESPAAVLRALYPTPAPAPQAD